MIELLTAVVSELKNQVKKFDTLQGNQDEVLDVKNALLKSFHGQFRGLLGRNFNFLGAKTRSLLRNINEIKRLIWLLVNADPVSFYTFLNDLRFNPNDEHFSIFTFCDDETMQVIDRLYRLCKDRIYTVNLTHGDDDESDYDKSMDKVYGKLTGKYLSQWNWFKDRAEKNIKDLKPFMNDYDFKVHFEGQSKMETIAKILREYETLIG